MSSYAFLSDIATESVLLLFYTVANACFIVLCRRRLQDEIHTGLSSPKPADAIPPNTLIIPPFEAADACASIASA